MIRQLCYFLIFTVSATAADIQISLDRADEHVLAHNPALAAARVRIEEARGRLRQAGRLSNPEIELDYAKNTRSPENAFSISLMQRFPVTARLRLEKAVSQVELAEAEAEVRNQERLIAGEARLNIVKLLGLRGQRALREQQIGNSRELAEFTRRRVQTAEASVVEATQVDLDVAQLNAELIQLEAESAALIGELRPLIGADPGDPITVSGNLPPIGTLPEDAVALDQRADFAAAAHKTEAARRGTALARSQQFEDFGIGVVVERDYTEDAPQGFERDIMAGVRITIPLPLWNRNQGRIHEATAATVRAGLETDALAVAIRAEAAAAREQMRLLAKLAGSLNEVLLPKAAQIEEQLRTSYSTGQSPLTEVLRARDKRLLLERQRLDALRDYHLARTRYAIATGKISGALRTGRRAK